MMKAKKQSNTVQKTQFVRFTINIIGPDGIEVQYPYGWFSAPKLVSIGSAVERAEYLLSFCMADDKAIMFNDTVVPRAEIDDGGFGTIDSAEIWDFTNGQDYFTDKNFEKIVEWSKEYERQIRERE